jgi:hypothetical protein
MPVANGQMTVEAFESGGVAVGDRAVEPAPAAPPRILSNTRSWQEWVRVINDTWQKGAGAFVATGKYLLEMREQLPREQVESIMELKLNFEASVGRKLERIAKNSIVCAHVHKLPPRWSIVYELTKVPDEILKTAFADGRIHPKMQRKDAVALRPRTPTGEGEDAGTPKTADSPPTLVDHWYQAPPEQQSSLFDTVPFDEQRKAWSPEYRKKLMDAVHLEKIDGDPHSTMTALLRRALAALNAADSSPKFDDDIVVKSNHVATLSALRGIQRVLAGLGLSFEDIGAVVPKGKGKVDTRERNRRRSRRKS